jgi:chromosome condensin MukBEF ATPase and DNA-binding subunit MukB
MSKSKVKDAKYEELKKQADKPTIESSIEALKAQLKDYLEKAEYFKTMAIKAEGALEVLSQLKEDNGES